MRPEDTTSCTAFADSRLIHSGDIVSVGAATKRALEADPDTTVLIFDDATGLPVEIDFRGSVEDVVLRLREIATSSGAETVRADDSIPRGPGRPKLGVVGREVTLLPRHWDWLATQPGGASVTLRKLVEDARRASTGEDRVRAAKDAAYRFMTAIGGDLPDYEEATRALFAGDGERFARVTAEWPPDIQRHALRLAAPAFG